MERMHNLALTLGSQKLMKVMVMSHPHLQMQLNLDPVEILGATQVEMSASFWLALARPAVAEPPQLQTLWHSCLSLAHLPKCFSMPSQPCHRYNDPGSDGALGRKICTCFQALDHGCHYFDTYLAIRIFWVEKSMSV